MIQSNAGSQLDSVQGADLPPHSSRQVHELRQPFDPWNPSWEAASTAAGGINESAEAFMQWRAAQRLLEHRKMIEAEGVALIRAVSVLMQHRLQPPTWLSVAFLKRWQPFENLEVISLDEAFDHKITRRTAETIRRHRSLVKPVSDALCGRIHVEPDRPIDGLLFDEIGADLGIGGTTCRTIYDLGVDVYGMCSLVKLKEILVAVKRIEGSTEGAGRP